MTNWMSKSDTPPQGRPLLCYAPDWSVMGYQVAEFIGGKFSNDDAPNNDFDQYVVSWSLFMEAD